MKNKNTINLNKSIKTLLDKYHVRYELGEPYSNGSDERINQVNQRVCTLFESTFAKEDEITVLIKDWQGEDIMFGNTTPEHIFKLIEPDSYEIEIEHSEDEDNLTWENKVFEKSGLVKNINYRGILSGIANYEQGREPSIAQAVYFINKKVNIIFHMYDDRGCIIYANDKMTINHLYVDYNDWLVDYWRSSFDRMFA